MNASQLLLAYADGQLSEPEEQAIEARLDSDSSLRQELASLFRERLMLAEFVLEQKAQNDTSYAAPRVVATPKTCDFCETADTSSCEMLPNEEIFTDYVSGRLSRAECDDVEKQLADDKLLEQEFAAFCRNRFLFAEAASSQQGIAIAGGLKTAQSKYKRRLYQSTDNRSYAWLKIAALFVAIAGGAWFLSRYYQGDGADRVATVNDTRSAASDVTPVPVDVSPAEIYVAVVAEPVNEVEINREPDTVVAEEKTSSIKGDEIIVPDSSSYQNSGENRVAAVNETRPATKDVATAPVGVSPVETYIAAVTELDGKVEIHRHSGTVVAETKTRIMDGDEIIVRAGMVTVKFNKDNSTIKLRSHSAATLEIDQSVTAVVLSRGTLAAAIEKQDSDKMVFKTPHARMEVLGTQFLLATSGDNTTLEMSAGSVRMNHARTGQAKIVKAGEYAVASSKTLTTGKTGLEVLGITLINTDTMQPLSGYDTITPGGAIRLSRLGADSLTIAVNTMPLLVDKLDMVLAGPKGFAPLKQTEEYYPYLITMNMSTSHWVDTSYCEPITPPLIPGKYTLTVTVQGKESGVSKQIARSMSFTVVK